MVLEGGGVEEVQWLNGVAVRFASSLRASSGVFGSGLLCLCGLRVSSFGRGKISRARGALL